jgi:glycosyltransferase involved in cell wall biosynthesis
MEDFPAGPACPGPRRPPLSVVVPVRDGAAALRRCLRGLRDCGRADLELVVVDDGSTDDSAAVAAEFGAVVFRHPGPLGPAAARNAGARVASAPLVFFLDADVVLHPDAIEKALARFDADPGLVALFGSYDDAPAAPGLVSRFRNLLHHFTHQQGAFRDDARPVHTFWTGCGAIRRGVFLGHGGFDPLLYRRPAIEDIELGYRLTRAGHRIVLARDVQATHLKRWSLPEVVRTDIFRRGVPWTLLMLRSGVAEADLNVSRSQRLSVALTGLSILALAAAPWAPSLLAVAASSLAANVALNRRFFRFLARTGGWRLASAAVPLHQVYYLCCGVSVLLAMAIWLVQGRPKTPAIAPAPKLRERAATALPRPNSTRPRRPTRWTGK